MPAIDVVQLVHSSVERNREIPAVLDAYGEFLDSPIGPLELQSLGSVFSCILDNLSQRFPDIASKRAANTAQNDISSFLSATNNNVDRVKDALRTELLSVRKSIVATISERFSKMNAEERRAIDATLRIIRRSQVELLFRADMGQHLSSAPDFARYIASIKSQSPQIRDLRYENLIVEKAIFNKLILKSKDHDYSIWVPSFYAKESADELIEKAAVQSDHLLLERIRQLSSEGALDKLRPFLDELIQDLGVLKSVEVPQELSDFFQTVGEYRVLPPIDLDDVSLYFGEVRAKEVEKRRAEEEKQRVAAEAHERDEERKSEQLRERLRATKIQVPVEEAQTTKKTENSIYLGKQLDFEQLIGAINRRVPEKDLPSQVSQLGDCYLEIDNLKGNAAIVGSSGSGRSTTVRRMIDGLAGNAKSPRLIVIDQKGEHRGVAWKYGWKVWAFASDSQAEEFKVSLLSSASGQDPSLASDLIQEWFNQGGQNFADQQRERVASLIRSQSTGAMNVNALVDLMGKEQELAQATQKLRKNLTSKSTFSRIFSENAIAKLAEGSSNLFDISGRGLKDPTNKEERQLISVILLRDLLSLGVKDSIIVVEDALDRFKSDSLKAKTKQIVDSLRSNGNTIISTSRSNVREFLGKECLELVHRLSGEKVINEEFSEFRSDVPTSVLAKIIGMLPRGYLVTSKIGNLGNGGKSAAVRVEPLQFSTGQV